MQAVIRECQIESKYMKSWSARNITLNLKQRKLIIESKNGQKRFNMQNISFLRKKYDDMNYFQINTGLRVYKIIINENSQYLQRNLERWKKFITIPIIIEEKIQIPQQNDYQAPLRQSIINQSIRESMRHSGSKLFQDYSIIKPLFKHKRQPSYLKVGDWILEPQQGGILFINQKKKSNQGQIVKYVVKKILSTGSFNGVSFPTFAMKPESILQTYCKSMGVAPLIFPGSTDPIERVKLFNCFILTLSILFTDMDKPFNSTIGQTFQATLGGLSIYGQQVSHHPPISAILLYGEGYTIHTSLQLTANISINSAIGLFYGEIWIQFEDGGVIRGRMPSGILSGLILGKDRFGPYGACYSYDPKNKIFSSYEVVKDDILVGYIGKLNKKTQQKFMNYTRKQKYQNYKHISERQLEIKYSKMVAIWSKQVSYDNEVYIDYSLEKWLPYDLQFDGIISLDSDSRKRKDIHLRSSNLIEQSQLEKQRIEEDERRNRKLRQIHKKKQ